jgi:hypothetical protein
MLLRSRSVDLLLYSLLYSSFYSYMLLHGRPINLLLYSSLYSYMLLRS